MYDMSLEVGVRTPRAAVLSSHNKIDVIANRRDELMKTGRINNKCDYIGVRSLFGFVRMRDFMCNMLLYLTLQQPDKTKQINILKTKRHHCT